MDTQLKSYIYYDDDSVCELSHPIHPYLSSNFSKNTDKSIYLEALNNGFGVASFMVRIHERVKHIKRVTFTKNAEENINAAITKRAKLLDNDAKKLSSTYGG